MAIVNFAIPPALDRRIGSTMKEKGFASKAEFFRFAAVYFMDVINKPFANEDDRTEHLTATLRSELARRFRGKCLPSAREQLKDL